LLLKSTKTVVDMLQEHYTLGEVNFR